jgi:hypothetical protein
MLAANKDFYSDDDEEDGKDKDEEAEAEAAKEAAAKEEKEEKKGGKGKKGKSKGQSVQVCVCPTSFFPRGTVTGGPPWLGGPAPPPPIGRRGRGGCISLCCRRFETCGAFP